MSRASIEVVRRAARGVFRTEQATEAWLTLRSRHLGTTPLACTADGHGDLVLAVLRLIARHEAPDDRFSPSPPPRAGGLRRRLAALWPGRRRPVRPPPPIGVG